MHLLKLIESILDISKIENGSSHLEISQVCLNQLILDTVQEIGGQALEKSLSLSYIIPPKKFRYMTDLFKLKQVIINLLGNAIKFTDEGYVKIELVWDESTDRPLSIQILDTGIGIKEDKLPKLFDKFYQVDKKYNRRHSGTGLGLYISKQLCILLNLELTVSSEFQKGSCFTITFPNPPKVTDS
jgi:signal transduction histidine kinase